MLMLCNASRRCMCSHDIGDLSMMGSNAHVMQSSERYKQSILMTGSYARAMQSSERSKQSVGMGARVCGLMHNMECRTVIKLCCL